jgi:hypothetical protein
VVLVALVVLGAEEAVVQALYITQHPALLTLAVVAVEVGKA